nr:hypothetical protein [uncultured Roseateles sp.]
MAAHHPLKPFVALAFVARHGQVACSVGCTRLFAFAGLRRFVPDDVTSLGAGSLALPAAAPGSAFLWGIGFAHAGRVAALLHNVLVQLALLLANRSVKGTHNGGPGLSAFACSVPPSCAPYLQR